MTNEKEPIEREGVINAERIKLNLENRIERTASLTYPRINNILQRNCHKAEEGIYVDIGRALLSFFPEESEIRREAQKRVILNYIHAGWKITVASEKSFSRYVLMICDICNPCFDKVYKEAVLESGKYIFRLKGG